MSPFTDTLSLAGKSQFTAAAFLPHSQHAKSERLFAIQD